MWFLLSPAFPRRPAAVPAAAAPTRPPRQVLRIRGDCRRRTLCQPALAPLIGLHVAEALAVAAADAEVELAHVLVLAQRVGLAVHDDAAVLQDVAVVGVLE